MADGPGIPYELRARMLTSFLRQIPMAKAIIVT